MGGNVRSLPDEFCLLQSLEYLALRYCMMLPSLPSSFGDLRELRHLDLSNCHMLNRLPDSFKNLKLLEYLNLTECRELTLRSGDLNCLENITKLEFLKFGGCRHLEELPRHITNQASLRELHFWNTRIRELPENVGLLTRLRELSISHMPLTSLPTSLGDLSSMTKLRFTDCHKLERLPDSIGSLSSLMWLSIIRCLELKSLPESLGALSSLTGLFIAGCPKLEREGVKSLPKSIGQLNNLGVLTLYSIPINELDFGGSSNPKSISLEETQVCRISLSEASCPHLERLEVFNNDHLMEIEALPRSLRTIRLRNCEALKNIPSFAGLTSLTTFRLEGCYGIGKIQGLENCTRMEELIAETQWEVPGIESLEHMQKLKEVVLIANKGTVIERCIQRIQKWPDREMMICGLAVPDAASLVEDILLSRNLVIVESVSNQNIMQFEPAPKSVLSKLGISDGDAILFCFVVNCVSSQMTVWMTLGGYAIDSVKVRKGRWAVVRVITLYGREGVGSYSTKPEFYPLYDGEGEVEKDLVVKGAEQTAMEALRSLLPIFS